MGRLATQSISLFALTSALGLGLSPATALADPKQPVPIQGTVRLDQTPYQAQQAIADATTCAPQCVFPAFPAVPAGRRLVVTHISAQLGSSAQIVVLGGAGDAVLFATKPYASSSFLSQAVTLFYGPNQTPIARMFVPDTQTPTSLIVAISGYLLPE